MFLLSAALALLGLALLWRGLRGRRINDHPLCRHCRFDLHGLYPGKDKCPECGRLLDRPKAIRIGQRKRRRPTLAAAAVILLACAALTTLTIWGRASGFNWNTVKPVWLLMREARGTDAPTSDGALAEVIRRLGADKLSDSQIQTIVEAGLDRQADKASRWSTVWGDFIELNWTSGRLTEDQIQRYARNAVELKMEPRPRVRRGEPLPIALDVSWRAARTSALCIAAVNQGLKLGPQQLRGSVDHFCIALGDPTFPRASERFEMGPDPEWISRWESPDLRAPVDTEAGNHALTSRWDIYIGHNPGASKTSWSLQGIGSESARSNWDNDPAWVTKVPGEFRDWGDIASGSTPITVLDQSRAELSASVDVVEQSASDITLVNDASLADSIQASLGLPHASVDESGMRLRTSTAFYSDTAPPIDVAFDVFWRVDGKEHKGGWIARSKGEEEFFVDTGLLPRINATTIDVILRPSPAAARRSTSIDRIWDGELVYTAIALNRRSQSGFTAPPTAPSDESANNSRFEVVAEFISGDGEIFHGNAVFRTVALHIPFVYIFDRDGGLHIFRIPEETADPRTNVEVAPIPDFGNGRDLEIIGGFLLATGDGGIRVYSLADPAAPALIATVVVEGIKSSSQLVRHGLYLYLIAGPAIAVFDITDPGSPRLLGTTPTERWGDGACIVGDSLCIEDYSEDSGPGISIYDIHEPTAPRSVGFVQPSPSPTHLFAVGPDVMLACLDASSMIGHGGRSVDGNAAFVSLADPANPTIVAEIPNAGGRTAALIKSEQDQFLVCNGGVFRVKKNVLELVGDLVTGGSSLDGRSYGGDSVGDYAAITMDHIVVVIRLKAAAP